jgi:hypothetical protein
VPWSSSGPADLVDLDAPRGLELVQHVARGGGVARDAVVDAQRTELRLDDEGPVLRLVAGDELFVETLGRAGVSVPGLEGVGDVGRGGVGDIGLEGVGDVGVDGVGRVGVGLGGVRVVGDLRHVGCDLGVGRTAGGVITAARERGQCKEGCREDGAGASGVHGFSNFATR